MSATIKVTELFSTTNTRASVYLWRLHGYVLDFMHVLAMGVAETSYLKK